MWKRLVEVMLVGRNDRSLALAERERVEIADLAARIGVRILWDTSRRTATFRATGKSGPVLVAFVEAVEWYVSLKRGEVGVIATWSGWSRAPR